MEPPFHVGPVYSVLSRRRSATTKLSTSPVHPALHAGGDDGPTRGVQADGVEPFCLSLHARQVFQREEPPPSTSVWSVEGRIVHRSEGQSSRQKGSEKSSLLETYHLSIRGTGPFVLSTPIERTLSLPMFRSKGDSRLTHFTVA